MVGIGRMRWFFTADFGELDSTVLAEVSRTECAEDRGGKANGSTDFMARRSRSPRKNPRALRGFCGIGSLMMQILKRGKRGRFQMSGWGASRRWGHARR
jgi:hypothetical protein